MDLQEAHQRMLDLESIDLYQVPIEDLIRINQLMSEEIDNETEWYQETWDEESESQFDAIQDELMARGVM